MQVTGRKARALWNQCRLARGWFADPLIYRALSLECHDVAHTLREQYHGRVWPRGARRVHVRMVTESLSLAALADAVSREHPIMRAVHA